METFGEIKFLSSILTVSRDLASALFSGNLSLEMPESTKEPGILYGYTVKQVPKSIYQSIYLSRELSPP
jgi:hypothetical protein